jgi:hypothetical protein
VNLDTYQVHYPQFIIVKIVMIKFIKFKIVVSVTVEVIMKVFMLYFLTKQFHFMTSYSHLFLSSIHFQLIA